MIKSLGPSPYQGKVIKIKAEIEDVRMALPEKSLFGDIKEGIDGTTNSIDECIDELVEKRDTTDTDVGRCQLTTEMNTMVSSVKTKNG